MTFRSKFNPLLFALMLGPLACGVFATAEEETEPGFPTSSDQPILASPSPAADLDDPDQPERSLPRSIWDIAETMLSECSNQIEYNPGSGEGDVATWLVGENWVYDPSDPVFQEFQSGHFLFSAEWYLSELRFGAWGLPMPTPEYPAEPLTPLSRYTRELVEAVIERHPEFIGVNSPWESIGEWFWWGTTQYHLFRSYGRVQDPFGTTYFTQDPIRFQVEAEDFDERGCLPYVLFYENYFPPEGGNVTLGDGYLFYEVGGTDHFRLDGRLREVRFTFPDLPANAPGPSATPEVVTLQMLQAAVDRGHIYMPSPVCGGEEQSIAELRGTRGGSRFRVPVTREMVYAPFDGELYLFSEGDTANLSVSLPDGERSLNLTLSAEGIQLIYNVDPDAPWEDMYSVSAGDPLFSYEGEYLDIQVDLVPYPNVVYGSEFPAGTVFGLPIELGPCIAASNWW